MKILINRVTKHGAFINTLESAAIYGPHIIKTQTSERVHVWMFRCQGTGEEKTCIENAIRLKLLNHQQIIE